MSGRTKSIRGGGVSGGAGTRDAARFLAPSSGLMSVHCDWAVQETALSARTQARREAVGPQRDDNHQTDESADGHQPSVANPALPQGNRDLHVAKGR